MRKIVLAIAGACGLGLTLGGAPVSAQSSSAGSSPVSPVLDVPYLPQSELLCGGAALAMVERWWGRRGVFAEDFVELVRPEMRGISTTALAAAARERGWETRVFDGTPEEVQQFLVRGVPVVVLIQVAPDRYHYVVVLGWTAGRVTFHDPARSPYRSLDEPQFLTEWNGAERWAMVLRPSADSPATPDTRESNAADSINTGTSMALSTCQPWLDQAFDAVAADQLDTAAELLAEAGHACPGEPRLLRELAGVRFKQRRLTEAVRLSGQYVTQAPDDPRGWQLLAASRYLSGDREGALEAWNHVGQLTVDLIRIDGVRGVRYRTIADAMEVSNGKVLTSTHLALARRRVSDLPALRRASIQYQPVEGGRAEVQAVVAERPTLGSAWRLLASGGISAIFMNQIGVLIATPTGGGELWTGVWRWEHAHPRAAFRVDTPARLGVTGVLGLEGSWERFRFSLARAPQTRFEQTRRAGGVSFGSWVLPSLRPSVGIGLERWSGDLNYLDFTVGAEFRAARDRLVLTTSMEYGKAPSSHPSYTRSRVLWRWASSPELRHAAWAARLGADLASVRAPLGTWPVASGDFPWAIPLRAHPRTSDNLLSGVTTGRRMLHGGLSGDHPVYRWGPLTLSAGLFLDAAEIMDPADGFGRAHLYLDTGGGIRIGILNGDLGILRIDLATGLTDRRTALTVGVHRTWPP